MKGMNMATTAAFVSSLSLLMLNNPSSSVALHLSTIKPGMKMGNINISVSGTNSTRFGAANRFSLDLLHLNLQKLESLRKLEKNWNGYESEIINGNIIDFAKDFISKLAFQPQVFPTGRGTLQIEKYFDKNNFYEIEVSESAISLYSRRNSLETELEVPIGEMDRIVADINA